MSAPNASIVGITSRSSSAELAGGRARRDPIPCAERNAEHASAAGANDMPKIPLTSILLALDGWTDPGPLGSTCFVSDDEADTSGANAAGKGKMFSQEDVDRVVEQRLARERRSFETKLAEATKAEADKGALLQKQLEELTAKFEDAGKSAGEKELAAMRRELASMTQRYGDASKSLEALTKERDEAIGRHRDEVVSTRFATALGKAKVLSSALGKATASLRGESTVELDERGHVQVTWNGRVYGLVTLWRRCHRRRPVGEV